MTARRPVSETLLTVTVTVRVGDEFELTRTVQQLSGSPLHHVSVAQDGIGTASGTVLAALAGAYGDIPTPVAPPTKGL